jgi:hypothetical protein
MLIDALRCCRLLQVLCVLLQSRHNCCDWITVSCRGIACTDICDVSEY